MSQTKAKKPEPLTSHKPSHKPEDHTAASNDAAQQETPHGTHERSHAAHLNDEDTAKPSTKPAGNLRQGSHPGGRRQP